MATKTQRYKVSLSNISKFLGAFLSVLVPLWQKKATLYSISTLFLFLFFSCGGADKSTSAEFIHQDSLCLIPQPMSLEKRENSFKIDFETYLPGESIYVLYKTTSSNISKEVEKKSI